MTIAPTIKAIPTAFNGITFRSRLEARYAVMLHAAGIRYEYEPEGYSFPIGGGETGTYLPDFILLNIRDSPRLYAEVKPASFPSDKDYLQYMWKMDCFTQANQCGLLMFIGQPQPRPWLIIGTVYKTVGDYDLTYFYNEGSSDRPDYRTWVCAGPDEDTGFGPYCDRANNAKFDRGHPW